MTRRARPFRATILVLASLCCAALPTAGCGAGDGAHGASPAAAHGAAEATAPLLARLAEAPERVAHQGRRRVEVRITVAGLSRALVYEESVVADGRGRYGIEPVSVVTPALAPHQREAFEELQRARQGFFFKYRDPRVRDVGLFLQNYAVQAVEAPAIVAGTECVELEIAPRHGPARSYRLAVEPRTGLVLRAIERDASGVEVARSEYLDFDLEPDLAGVEFHAERYAGRPLEAATSEDARPAARPQILPDGYREISSEHVEVGDDAYVRRVFGDGFENAFLLERLPRAAGDDPATADAAGAAPASLVVRVAEVGAYRVAELERGGGAIYVVGKLAEDEVLAILRSAL